MKVKLADGETVKEHREHDPAERHQLTPAARELLDRVLGEHLGAPPAAPAQSLVTKFRRSTLGHATEAERLTIDVDVALVRPDGTAGILREPCAIVETKSRDGDGRCDALLRDAGYAPISLSKYRTGIGLLAADDPDPPSPDPRELFRVDRHP